MSNTYHKAMNRLNHWGMLLTGRIVGTLRSEDPRSKGYRDLFQKLLILRAEVTVLTGLLLELSDSSGNQLISLTELQQRLVAEADKLCKDYEERFPGFRSTDDSLLVFDPEKAAEVMKGWPQ